MWILFKQILTVKVFNLILDSWRKTYIFRYFLPFDRIEIPNLIYLDLAKTWIMKLKRLLLDNVNCMSPSRQNGFWFFGEQMSRVLSS